MPEAPATRLGPGFGLLIDPDRPVAFSFEGRQVAGFEGDVIASALAANSQWLLSRSFKYHRPRGILTMAGQDANTLVQVGDEPNVLADRRPIESGLTVGGQNVWGSLRHDGYAILDRLGRFLPVGFYYRSFFRPKGAWRFWEPWIRQLAGLGRVDLGSQHEAHDKAYGFTDVLVIGGGPAGLSAALEAASHGLEVTLVDEWPVPGGALLYARFDLAGARGPAELHALYARLQAEPRITVMADAIATGLFSDGLVPVVQGRRLHKIRAKQVVVASGAFEQPMVFRNNDRPGVMLSSAVARLMRLYGVRPGRTGVVATANEHGYALALDLLDAGVEVAGVLDLRPELPAYAATMLERGVHVHPGATVVEALGTRHLTGVRLGEIAFPQQRDGALIACDFLATAVGYAPASNLIAQAGGTLAYDETRALHRIARLPENTHAAGSVRGVFDLDAVLADGRRSGFEAARALDRAHGPAPDLPADPEASTVNHHYPIFPHPKGKDFVDFDEDLQVEDLEQGIRHGFDDIQLLKRYSTLGMGPSQGRHANLNAIRIVAAATRQRPDEVGTPTSRPPFAPESFAHLAGRAFDPVRHSPIHHRHLEAGARMMVAGTWLRAAHYGSKGQADETIANEVRHTRQAGGLIDVSTLGKLEIRGPAAAAFLERMYTFSYQRQPVGRARYALMTDETGVIVDDGVACRLGETHFYVTATTGGADGVFRQMLRWNAEWQLDVDITNVTAAYAAVNIAGPRSRDVLAKLTPLDLSPDGFPYMGVRVGVVAGIPCRLLRVGFVGELGYELHAPASQGEALWEALAAAGASESIRPFGVEAQRVLRLEKGHVIVGQDTDGLTHPYEAAMGWAIASRKPFFVGKRAIEIQLARGLARTLTGFTLTDPEAPCPKECQLVIRDGLITGRVTSAVRSPTLDRVIGLAYVAPDQAEHLARFEIKVDGGRLIEAAVTPLPFYDPDNARQEP